VKEKRPRSAQEKSREPFAVKKKKTCSWRNREKLEGKRRCWRASKERSNARRLVLDEKSSRGPIAACKVSKRRQGGEITGKEKVSRKEKKRQAA